MRRWVVTMCAVTALLAAVLRPAAALHPARDFMAVAHRGGASLAPENTIAAFRNGADVLAGLPHGREAWLEMDVQATSDGHLVVIHDDKLDRTTDCTGRVNATTLSQIATCNAAEAWPSFGFQPVPSLRDVMKTAMEAVPQWRLMVELKNIPGESNFDALGMTLASKLVSLVAQTGFPKQNLIVQSFWPPSLDAVESLDPQITTLLLTTSTLPGAPDGVGFTLVENAGFSAVRGYEYAGPDADAFDVTAEGVAIAHQLGRRVVVWTVDDSLVIERLKAAGVDGIMSNDPRLLL